MIFKEEFREELPDISGAPGSPGRRQLETDAAITDLIVRLGRRHGPDDHAGRLS